ncbi:MAG: DNA-3-methyladenine glycosylase I [Micrococcales bacterium]|nr:DNA-3-methyladenine glycosylase I [Actinomycetota bacterium]NCA07714.1 DNA-3-methyladenine glycosylase I [Micrococcales bacterium]
MADLVHKYEDGRTRCRWPGKDQLYIDYHDNEWGVPVFGDDEMFERITLEGFQAGLSWITILKRREGFRKAFKNFEVTKVARMTEKDVERLMLDEGIIRNRSKIASTIKNANLVLELQKQGQSISDIVWDFAPSKSKRTPSASAFEWRATSPESDSLSKHLKALGFGFVGPTTMYALMQATGFVNDHAPGCFRRAELKS